MTENKHTPGPWVVGDLTTNMGTAIWASHQEVTSNGYKYTPKIADVPFGTTPKETEEMAANANLIAAAPETAAERDRLREINAVLLEATEHLISVLDAANLLHLSDGVHLGKTSWYIKATDAKAWAQDAIAKAKAQSDE